MNDRALFPVDGCDARRDFAVEVVRRLREAGHQALLAGGCVRDLLMGHPPSDFDVATDARPEEVMRIFRRTVPVGVSFGVVRVLGPRDAGEVEVATFRSDGAYLDGRHPESVRFSTAEEDASRRDFTINGMFLDPLDGSVLDHVGGREDLRRGVVRAIGDPAERFREDKLRLLRAVRFAARFGFELEPATRAAVGSMAAQIRVVAAERVADELRKMLVHPSRAAAMRLALDVGLVREVLPPLVAMRGLPQHKPACPDGDLWDHTMLALESLGPAPSFPLAFATLLHDVGKPSTRGLKDGRMTFHNHEIVGRRIADELSRALKLSNAERERVAWLVEQHQALGAAKELRESRLKAILASPGIDELLELHRADALASNGDTAQVDYCRWYLANQPQGPIDPPPLVTGHDLQKRLGLAPGPQFKGLLDSVREAQLERVVGSKAEALEWVRRLLQGREPRGAAPMHEDSDPSAHAAKPS
jgi:poly(A) polymerase